MDVYLCHRAGPGHRPGWWPRAHAHRGPDFFERVGVYVSIRLLKGVYISKRAQSFIRLQPSGSSPFLFYNLAAFIFTSSSIALAKTQKLEVNGKTQKQHVKHNISTPSPS